MPTSPFPYLAAHSLWPLSSTAILMLCHRPTDAAISKVAGKLLSYSHIARAPSLSSAALPPGPASPSLLSGFPPPSLCQSASFLVLLPHALTRCASMAILMVVYKPQQAPTEGVWDKATVAATWSSPGVLLMNTC